MKIVHVLPALTKGGGERIAVELANHAARTGHQVTMIVAYRVDPSLLRDDLHADIEVRYVSETVDSKTVRYIYLFSWIWLHRSWLAEQHILHCHLTYGVIFGILVRGWRSVTGAKGPLVVQTNHSVGGPMPPLRRWLLARMAAHCDVLALIAEDEYWRSFASRHPEMTTQVIFNGISNPSCEPISSAERIAYRRKIGIPDECNLVVGAVGRLEADRKPWMYLPIFAEISREFGSEVHFVLAGGGAELDRMRSLVVEQGLEGQIHFPGQVIEPHLPLSVMNLYVSMNVGAATGLAGMEAALSGLPVLAIQWVSGYQAAPNDWIWSSTDPSEVAKRACELLHSPLDRQTLAQQQKAYVESHHTTEAMACSYYALYQVGMARF